MISTLFGLFGGASLITKLITIVSVAAALGLAYGGWHLHVYNKGYNAAIAAIARQDAKAVAAATAARAALRDCISRDLVWDQSTGECSGR
jgi:ApbE superfamily uncharacterized protein (UPF0280 family)